MSTERPKLYLLDVEGTVATVAFMTETLFPYARKHFHAFLNENLVGLEAFSREEKSPADGSALSDLWLLFEENWMERDTSAPSIVRELPPKMLESLPGIVSISTAIFLPRALEYIDWLMDRDRKSTALKSLQGKIWRAGYESGELKSELFDDVPGALERWSAEGRVAIYSSGSVEAQRLFFRYSNFGDLTSRIAGYFDTRTGAKRENSSYRAIAREMDVEPAEVQFFSDVVAELDAAREAGCETRLVIREGNSPVEDAHGHAIVRSFDETD